MPITKCRKPIWKGSRLFYDSNYMALWKRQNYGDSKKTGGFQEVVNRQRWMDRAQTIFRAVEILCMIPYWWIHAIILLCKHTDWATPRANCYINHGLCMMMMCQCRFMNFNTGTLVGAVDDGWGYVYVGTGCRCTLPFNFGTKII